MKPHITCSTSAREDWCLPVHFAIWAGRNLRLPFLKYCCEGHRTTSIWLQPSPQLFIALPAYCESSCFIGSWKNHPGQMKRAVAHAVTHCSEYSTPSPTLCCPLPTPRPGPEMHVGGPVGRFLLAAVQRPEVFLHCITAVNTLWIFTLSFPYLKINKIKNPAFFLLKLFYSTVCAYPHGEDRHAALMRDTIIALLANDLKLHNGVNYWAGEGSYWQQAKAGAAIN